MSSAVPKRLRAVNYEAAAQDYLRALPLEHFMEATPQARQRAITLASLALVEAQRDDFYVYNELLVQSAKVRGEFVQVVPDNMAVRSDEPPDPGTSYNVELEPAGPFWVMEYVSNSSKRKDYEDSFQKYERALKVPYYLIFYPDSTELTLYRHNGRKYVSVKPNEHERLALAEIEIEVALLGGWVRFWYQGKLLPLPAELQHELDAQRRRADAEKQRADEATRRADEATHRADEATHRADDLQKRLEVNELANVELRAQLERLRGRKNGV